jgi:4-hydroxy-3-methylbut-2-enyl diphosphate reductase
VRRLLVVLRERFPQSEIHYLDTVCRPTKQRQTAAVDTARRSDVMVVIGGARSNNTAELVATCRRYCARVHHVQTAECLREEWFDGVETVGLTAGTSTPDAIINEVEQWLQQVAAGRPRPGVSNRALLLAEAAGGSGRWQVAKQEDLSDAPHHHHEN